MGCISVPAMAMARVVLDLWWSFSVSCAIKRFSSSTMEVMSAASDRRAIDGECIRGKRVGYSGRVETVTAMMLSRAHGPERAIVVVLGILHTVKLQRTFEGDSSCTFVDESSRKA